MTVTFNQIPSDIRVPLTYFEFNAGGTTFDAESKAVIVAQKKSGGTTTAGALTIVGEGSEDGLFGVNSMAALMVKAFKRNAPSKTPYVIALDDPSGTAATATITVSDATAPSSETIFLSISGASISVAVTSGETAAAIATKIAAKINSTSGHIFTAAAAAAVVTLTAGHVGTELNNIKIKYTSGVLNVAVTDTSGGTGAVDMTGVLDVIPEGQYYDWIVTPYSDSTSIGHYATYTNDTSGTWNPLDGSLGHVITVNEGTLAAQTTLGNSLNDRHLSVVGVEDSVTPKFLIPAVLGAVAVSNLAEPPNLSRPLQFVELRGIELGENFTTTERNTLYYDGIGALRVDRTGAVQIDRVLTTYQTNAAGSQDTTYLDVQTLAQLMYATRYLKTRIESIYARTYLNDQVLEDLEGDIIHALTELRDLAVIENIEATLENMTLERNATDANRVDVYLPLDHVNQLRVLATNITSFLNIGA